MDSICVVPGVVHLCVRVYFETVILVLNSTPVVCTASAVVCVHSS
jgi:hypothetical protein